MSNQDKPDWHPDLADAIHGTANGLRIPRSPVIDALLKDEVYGEDHVEFTEKLNQHRLDDIAERSGQLLEDSLKPVHVGNWDDIVNAASQAKDSEMFDRLRLARGDYPSNLEIKAAEFIQARITEQAHDVFMHGKPLTTMTEAEYNEAKIRKASKDATEKPQQVNKGAKGTKGD